MADNHDEKKPQENSAPDVTPSESLSTESPAAPEPTETVKAVPAETSNAENPTVDSQVSLEDGGYRRGTEPMSPLSETQKDDLQSKIQTAKLVDANERPDTVPTVSRNPLAALSPLFKYDPKNPDTAVLHGKSPARRNPNSDEDAPDAPMELIHTSEQREIILVIRGMVERLVMKDGKQIVLGRTDIKTRTMPNVDLTPYGALDRGVSREHCALHIEGDKIFVTDLGSTNGTWLATERLIPNQPRQLRKGEELLLGRLPVQVLFR